MDSSIPVEIHDHQLTPEFWAMMGPFFASKHVRREMPYLCHEEGYRWFVARDEAGTVLGFASLHVDGKGTGHIHGLYVVPEHRRENIAERMLLQQLGYCVLYGVSKVQVVASVMSKTLFEKNGFGARGARGTYTVMDRSLVSEVRA